MKRSWKRFQRLALALPLVAALLVPATAAQASSGGHPGHFGHRVTARPAGVPNAEALRASIQTVLGRAYLTKTRVEGTFETPPEPASICPNVGPEVDCQVDLLYGHIGGTVGAFDQLITIDYNDSGPVWPYVDGSLTHVHYGKFPATPIRVFRGYEAGQVVAAEGLTQGDFTSDRLAWTADYCRVLVLHFEGFIDLSGVLTPTDDPVNNDHGTYAGWIIRFC